MARKRSLMRRVVVLGILGLAVFGGLVLYKGHEERVNDGYNKVSSKVKAVGKALKE